MRYAYLRPLLFTLPAELAHTCTLKLLDYCPTSCLPKLSQAPRQIMGLHFTNPIGVAAGLDKDGQHIDGLAKFGFGFIEVGTVTPQAQPGNPQPRLFRLPKAHALINRMGFNNQGVDSLVARLSQRQYKGILGVNIGKNRDTPLSQAIDDYRIGMQKVYPEADYITINISSPNTAGLRDLQAPQTLPKLLTELKSLQTQLNQQHQRYVPLAIKIAPDLDDTSLQIIAKQLLAHDIDAVIATNTTTSRPGVEKFKHGHEKGGLSGQPLTQLANHAINILAQNLAGRIPIVGIGGIMSAQDVHTKLQAGANLVQLYTGLGYRGFDLIKELQSTKF